MPMTDRRGTNFNEWNFKNNCVGKYDIGVYDLYMVGQKPDHFKKFISLACDHVRRKARDVQLFIKSKGRATPPHNLSIDDPSRRPFKTVVRPLRSTRIQHCIRTLP